MFSNEYAYARLNSIQRKLTQNLQILCAVCAIQSYFDQKHKFENRWQTERTSRIGKTKETTATNDKQTKNEKKLCRNILKLIKWHKDTLSSCYYAIAHRWQRIIFVNMLNYYGNKHFLTYLLTSYTHMRRKRKTIVTSSRSFTMKRKRKHNNWDEEIIKKEIFRRNDNNYYEDVINV